VKKLVLRHCVPLHASLIPTGTVLMLRSEIHHEEGYLAGATGKVAWLTASGQTVWANSTASGIHTLMHLAAMLSRAGHKPPWTPATFCENDKLAG